VSGNFHSLVQGTKVSSNCASEIWFGRRIVLTELHIENLGVIDTLDLQLSEGLVALTGETGAGKTMIVEAINLLVGGRADAGMVRPGATEARVEGRFVFGEEEVILCRTIPLDGRSRAYVNGRLATVSQLAEHGLDLVDMHGQHAHQSLLGAKAQREALDSYAKVDLEPLRSARAAVTEIDAALATLGGDDRMRAREIDLLRFQVNEIIEAALQGADEDELLSREEDVLADAVNYREALWKAVASLAEESGATDNLGTAISALSHKEPFAGFVTRLKALQSELEDVSADIRDEAESIEENPARLDAVRQRRQLLVDLRRKYGDSLVEVITFGEQSAVRLAELESFEARAATLDQERAAAVRKLEAAQSVVGKARRDGAGPLAQQVQKHLRTLAMAHAVIDVSVGQDPGDEVVFLLAANPGSPVMPLTKVASGGELARTMLALRLVLSSGPNTLVFDEVDAGIGGEAAVAVAQALAQLGKRHQVLVVTHLPQVAAAGHAHIQVSKSVRSGKTFAQAATLGQEERIAEIARMLSGGVAEATALEHARELLRDSHKTAGTGSVTPKRSRQ
jgi:DNA repair protein RecN (Recombination protein N)